MQISMCVCVCVPKHNKYAPSSHLLQYSNFHDIRFADYFVTSVVIGNTKCFNCVYFIFIVFVTHENIGVDPIITSVCSLGPKLWYVKRKTVRFWWPSWIYGHFFQFLHIAMVCQVRKWSYLNPWPRKCRIRSQNNDPTCTSYRDMVDTRLRGGHFDCFHKIWPPSCFISVFRSWKYFH